uniref:CSON008274 protein n=1 Tax=Culicoides sonorensis TaxID=179676 RepID=A0A336LBP0_CULSO
MSMDVNNHCFLCQTSENVIYGEFLHYRNKRTRFECNVHYLCMLLSPGLKIKGCEKNGLYGFLGPDIVKEEKRIFKQKCFFCQGKHANLSCYDKKCKKSFHVDCGIKNGCQYNTNYFSTWCADHRSYIKLKSETLDQNTESTCFICFESVARTISDECVFTNCCTERCYHRECIGKNADSAGYLFKCPLCQNESIFKEMVMSQSIFVPNRDASWEREHNAYAEQLERPSNCSATKCLSSKGTRYTSKGSQWEFIMCKYCGGQAIHQKCLKGNDFICFPCIEIQNGISDDTQSLQAEIDEFQMKCESSSEHIELEKRNMSPNVKQEPELIINHLMEVDDDHDSENKVSFKLEDIPFETENEKLNHEIKNLPSVKVTILDLSAIHVAPKSCKKYFKNQFISLFTIKGADISNLNEPEKPIRTIIEGSSKHGVPQKNRYLNLLLQFSPDYAPKNFVGRLPIADSSKYGIDYDKTTEPSSKRLKSSVADQNEVAVSLKTIFSQFFMQSNF